MVLPLFFVIAIILISLSFKNNGDDILVCDAAPLGVIYRRENKGLIMALKNGFFPTL
jgi:hypothetical protein